MAISYNPKPYYIDERGCYIRLTPFLTIEELKNLYPASPYEYETTMPLSENLIIPIQKFSKLELIL